MKAFSQRGKANRNPVYQKLKLSLTNQQTQFPLPGYFIKAHQLSGIEYYKMGVTDQCNVV